MTLLNERKETDQVDITRITEGKLEPINGNPPIFADEHARVAWGISQAVDRVVATLPPEAEDRDPKFQRITFRPKHRNNGIHAIFYIGTVIRLIRKTF